MRGGPAIPGKILLLRNLKARSRLVGLEISMNVNATRRAGPRGRAEYKTSRIECKVFPLYVTDLFLTKEYLIICVFLFENLVGKL